MQHTLQFCQSPSKIWPGSVGGLADFDRQSRIPGGRTPLSPPLFDLVVPVQSCTRSSMQHALQFCQSPSKIWPGSVRYLADFDRQSGNPYCLYSREYSYSCTTRTASCTVKLLQWLLHIYYRGGRVIESQIMQLKNTVGPSTLVVDYTSTGYRLLQ